MNSINKVQIRLYSHLDFQNNLANENSNGVLIVGKIHHNNIQSLIWKIFHGTHSMLGGLCLMGGSCMYFSEIVRRYSVSLTIGGWLFTMGSFFLLLADLQQWWYNRIGCCFDEKYRDVYELSNKNLFQQVRSLKLGQLGRTEIGIHSFVTACGSACYLAGSVLLIPTFEKYAVLGNWLIIAGSIIIFLCASWKIYRTGYINVANPYDHQFRLSNIFNDTSTLSIDVCVGFGGVFYFFGVILSVSIMNMTDSATNISAALCVVGGTFFFLASIFLQYRYYCRHH